MLKLDFINVGYGDAILVRDTDANFTLLVDCGNTSLGNVPEGSARITAADFLKKHGVETVDLLVLTHMHRDHLGGLPVLLDRVNVRRVWSTYVPPARFAGRRAERTDEMTKKARGSALCVNILQDALERLGRARFTEVTEAGAVALTDELTLEARTAPRELYSLQKTVLDGALGGCREEAFEAEYGEAINLTCIRLFLTYRDKLTVLGADTYGEAWEQEPLAPCYIFKAPHHGCPRSVTERLMRKLTPHHSVVSVSDDRDDDRPAPQTVALLKRYSGSVMFTDSVSAPGIPPSVAESVSYTLK